MAALVLLQKSIQKGGDLKYNNSNIESYVDPFWSLGEILKEEDISIAVQFSTLVKKLCDVIPGLFIGLTSYQDKNDKTDILNSKLSEFFRAKKEFINGIKDIELDQRDEFVLIRQYFEKIKIEHFQINQRDGKIICWVEKDWKVRRNIWYDYHKELMKEFNDSLEEEKQTNWFVNLFSRKKIDNGKVKKLKNDNVGILSSDHKRKLKNGEVSTTKMNDKKYCKWCGTLAIVVGAGSFLAICVCNAKQVKNSVTDFLPEEIFICDQCKKRDGVICNICSLYSGQCSSITVPVQDIDL